MTSAFGGLRSIQLSYGCLRLEDVFMSLTYAAPETADPTSY